MAIDEVALVDRAKDGDPEAFEDIFFKYKGPIYNYILRVMGNAEEANDLAQETFLRAYVALPKTSDDLRLEPWLFKIATNLCRDQFRRRKIVRWQPLENLFGIMDFEDHSSYKPEPETLRNEEAEKVNKVLETLSPDHRLCLILKEYNELSCDEIGEIMGRSRSAVKSLLFRAREQFRISYQKMEGKRAV